MVRKAFLREDVGRPSKVLVEFEGKYYIINTETGEKRKIDKEKFEELTKDAIPIAYVDDMYWLREEVQKRIDELVDIAVKEGRNLNDLEERGSIVEQACEEVFDRVLKEAEVESGIVFVREEFRGGVFQYFAYRDKPQHIIEDAGEETKRIWDKVYGYSFQPGL